MFHPVLTFREYMTHEAPTLADVAHVVFDHLHGAIASVDLHVSQKTCRCGNSIGHFSIVHARGAHGPVSVVRVRLATVPHSGQRAP
jgi:hypothetical protein